MQVFTEEKLKLNFQQFSFDTNLAIKFVSHTHTHAYIIFTNLGSNYTKPLEISKKIRLFDLLAKTYAEASLSGC